MYSFFPHPHFTRYILKKIGRVQTLQNTKLQWRSSWKVVIRFTLVEMFKIIFFSYHQNIFHLLFMFFCFISFNIQIIVILLSYFYFKESNTQKAQIKAKHKAEDSIQKPNLSVNKRPILTTSNSHLSSKCYK